MTAAFLAASFPLGARFLSRVGRGDSTRLDLVQQSTVRYFTDFAHPASGMARERSGGARYDVDNTVTTGGTGFGIMAMIAAAERGWIPREQVRAHIEKILSFLERADTYHGVFPHFLDGRTGKTIPFSKFDDGGDLVETSFLVMGLLTARQYFQSAADAPMRSRIDAIWHAVEWDWHVRDSDRQLLWHWSPHVGFAMDLPIAGWNECLITHVLAAASPTHPVPVDVFEKGWENSPTFKNGQEFYGIPLPLGPDFGGPLFFSHYSFLGLNPHALARNGIDYFTQNQNHARINHAHCVANPYGYKGYGAACWGLTACDADTGYAAHCPTNDRGIIAPTAALSSMPYTPAESMAALHHFFDHLGDRIWGRYGFTDSFSEQRNWYSPNHLAIDQGPIVIMIENHRSGLLWELGMSAPEIRNALNTLNLIKPAASPAPGHNPPHPTVQPG